MKAAVRYYSKSGHTRIIAEAIANTLGVEALDVSHPLEEEYDVVFLGSAIYAGKVDKKVQEFIHDNKYKIGEIYNFSTATLIVSTYKQMKKICEQEKVALSHKEFHCKGSFGPFEKHHPDKIDVINAIEWVQGCMR